MKLCSQEDYNKGMQWYTELEIRLGIMKPVKVMVAEMKDEQDDKVRNRT